ncbi:amidase family protein [Penicillium herquei]|nr:amidase family protein [Penicillium herquei]
MISDTPAQIKSLGAEAIENVPFSAAESRHQSLDIFWEIIRYEMNQSLPEFFSKMDGAPVKSLAELEAFNEAHESQAFAKECLRVMHVGFEGQDFLKEALGTNLTESQYHDLIAKTYDMAVVRGIENALEKNQLDFLLTPGWIWMSIYSAWANTRANAMEEV